MPHCGHWIVGGGACWTKGIIHLVRTAKLLYNSLSSGPITLARYNPHVDMLLESVNRWRSTYRVSAITRQDLGINSQLNRIATVVKVMFQSLYGGNIYGKFPWVFICPFFTCLNTWPFLSCWYVSEELFYYFKYWCWLFANSFPEKTFLYTLGRRMQQQVKHLSCSRKKIWRLVKECVIISEAKR